MNLHALYDRSGKILAAVELKSNAADAYLPRPVAQRGQRTADVSVPDEFRHLSFLEVCTQLAIRTKGNIVTLVPHERARRVTSSSSVPQSTSRRTSKRRKS
jgi:hypothetical protein